MPRPHIVVVGSSNTDLTVAAETLPVPGQTVIGGNLHRAGGGKGANQAVAAARAGAEVTFVGRVGYDDFGNAAIENLKAEGINTDCVVVDELVPSGVALIMVDRRGENLIAVASGANAHVSPADVRAAHDVIASADVVLLQMEIPFHTVRAVVSAAQEAGVKVLLNPAPVPEGLCAGDVAAGVDYLTPNRIEAARLLGASPDEAPDAMAARLIEAGAKAVFLTLGAQGACVHDGRTCTAIQPPKVRSVDTVGAGDCFAGTLAVALGEGRSPVEAARFATCAAALSVQKPGAQPSMPWRDAIDRLFERLYPPQT